MKKVMTIVLITALLLTGCGKTPKKAPKATAPTQATVEAALSETEETTVPAEPEAPTPTLPEESTPTEPEGSSPIEQEEPVPTEPTKEGSTQSSTPQTQSKPAENKPQQSNSAQSKPQPSSKPSFPSRPTSSATCKDTGAKDLWVEPFEKTYPYEETDPERKDYLTYLQMEGNPYFYCFDREYLLMHPGHTYGLPLVTSYELAMCTTWESSDPSIATVNQVGFVEVLKLGTVTITATLTDPAHQEPTVRKCYISVERSYEDYTIAELEQKAHEEAKEIATLVMDYEGATTDLERISLAAGIVHQYVKQCGPANIYFIENGMPTSRPIVGYNRPFGTLVTFYSSCAGDTRALGLVLEYMGFEWYHVNANENTHQWCVVYDVDGQTAFADASNLGAVGYGERKSDKSNWMVFSGGKLNPCQ